MSETTTEALPYGRCTCHSLRENSQGIVYSDYMLGVLCGSCEAAMGDWEEESRREALTPAERIAEDIATRWFTAITRWGRYDRRPGSPASHCPF